MSGKKEEFIYLPDEWVRQNLNVEEAMAVIEEVFRADGRGSVFLSDPPALTLEGRADIASYKVKGAVIPSSGVAGFRLISFRHLDNAQREQKSVNSSFSYLADLETGRPVALIDEGWQYTLRSGLMAPIALKYLAGKTARSATLIGAGRLAQAVLLGLEKAIPLEEITISSRTETKARTIAEQSDLSNDIELRVVLDIEEAVHESDLIITVTNADTAILHPAWVKAGATICTLGGAQELSPHFLDWADKFIVDDFEFCKLAGTIQAWIQKGYLKEEQISQEIYATIGEVVAGRKAGRENANENILVILQGMASCDLSLARFLFEKAKDSKSLQRIELS